ncbi:MAG: lipoate--protein ligase family protein, partial [Desulfobacterales bacterium]|nr:lipoate--protein ligase family protein [Desulfobacterales bacterium]
LQPAVNTYRSLGVDAYYRPVNDIQVDEKKISGTGAGRVGDASVVVGNIIFDFNYGEMSRVLRLSSEGFRDKVHDSMQLYVTTLLRELGHIPDRKRVKEILIKQFEELLG